MAIGLNWYYSDYSKHFYNRIIGNTIRGEILTVGIANKIAQLGSNSLSLKTLDQGVYSHLFGSERALYTWSLFRKGNIPYLLFKSPW